MNANATAIDAHVEAVIIPVLEQYGATITARSYDDFYSVLTISFRGQQIALAASIIDRADPKALKFFLKHHDRLQAIVADLMHVPAPFYSDVSIALDGAFGRRHDVDERSLAFSFICDKLRVAGKTIWTND